MRAEAVVEPDPARDLFDVRADQLADVRDLVDEADPRHQKGVRGQLDHLRRRDVRAHHHRVELLVELLDAVTVVGIERADHDPVGVHEVPNRSSLREELGVGDVADMLEAAGVEGDADRLARPDGNRALHHQHGTPGERRQVVEHAPDGGEIGVAGIRGGRPNADVEELGAFGGLGGVGRKVQPLSIGLDELGKARLVDRNVAIPKRLDLLGQHIANDDVVSQLREAGARDETDPTGPEDPDLAHCRFFFLFFVPSSGRSPRAIESMVSFESESRSVFTTQ